MNIPLPTTLTIKDAQDNKATVVIEPCYPGYGVTLGNSLRRVLLSSIEGGAISAFKVEGVQHEFSSLPLIKEDFVELMLNLKKIRLKVFSDEPVILNLDVKGEKDVTASDIEKNAQVEIINSATPIATLTDKNAVLKMELVAQKGTGYVTVEDRSKEKVDIGTIIIDAIFSPLVKVGFEIENVRVGERTDYEKLVLKIETDGTITPQEAVAQASNILVKHFQYIEENTGAKKAGGVKKTKKQIKEDEIKEIKEEETNEQKDKGVVKEMKEEKVVFSFVKTVEDKEEKPRKKRGRPRKI